MPFAVFRRHQRKLLAVFAILAMFGFVVADSLPRLLNGGPSSGGNPVVAELKRKTLHRSDINAMIAERNDANLFMNELSGLLTRRQAPQFFGDLTTKSIVDALILQDEADRLGIPAGPEVAREWLKHRVGPSMTKELFDLIHTRFASRVSGEQLLSELANQIRLNNVRRLPGAPVVTPLDVFQTYRDQNERVSARVVGFRVEDYLAKVSEPSPVDLQAYYEKYKNILPDPNRPTPGFKVPRQVQLEILSVDGEAMARSFKDKLTDAELLSYYENRKAEFKRPSQLPDEIFQGAPDLTPPLVQPFSEVRPYLATTLAEEKAQAEIIARFGRIKDEVMIPFADRYLEAADEIAEARKLGGTVKATLPKPEDLKPLAQKEGLEYESTPLLTRDRAEKYGLISGAVVGLNRMGDGKKFAEELFDTKSVLYEPAEFTDFTGRRFLVRKLQDVPPHVPTLEQVRPEAIVAWKTEKARPLAEQAARAYAAKVKAAGGKIEGEIVEGHPVITTDPVTKLQPGLPVPGQFFETGPPTPTEFAQIPNASPAIRDAYFGLNEGGVVVAPNLPESTYYVMALNRRTPATFAVLYAPNGDYFRYRSEAMNDAYKKRDEEWMNVLRAQAGLKRDWSPPDEGKKRDDEVVNG